MNAEPALSLQKQLQRSYRREKCLSGDHYEDWTWHSWLLWCQLEITSNRRPLRCSACVMRRPAVLCRIITTFVQDWHLVRWIHCRGLSNPTFHLPRSRICICSSMFSSILWSWLLLSQFILSLPDRRSLIHLLNLLLFQAYSSPIRHELLPRSDTGVIRNGESEISTTTSGISRPTAEATAARNFFDDYASVLS